VLNTWMHCHYRPASWGWPPALGTIVCGHCHGDLPGTPFCHCVSPWAPCRPLPPGARAYHCHYVDMANILPPPVASTILSTIPSLKRHGVGRARLVAYPACTICLPTLPWVSHTWARLFTINYPTWRVRLGVSSVRTASLHTTPASSSGRMVYYVFLPAVLGLPTSPAGLTKTAACLGVF